ncbi:MAG: alpha-L-fucosidase [Chitinophagaceae bacterium]
MKYSKKLLSAAAFAVIGISNLPAQQKIAPDSIKNKMRWFVDGKLGIFIHYGIYDVDGVTESWSFHNRIVPYKKYMNQLNGFTASRYNPEYWADLIKETGASYAVLTTKHHDGVALWDTKQSDLSIVKKTPAKRDLLAPFYAALRKRGIKAGAYFSLIDWSDSRYPGMFKDSNKYDIKNNPQRWAQFKKFMYAQLDEVAKEVNPDLWWFDGDWEHSAEEWGAPDIRKKLLSYNPNTIINGRLQGYGDYDTPEQNFPITRPDFHWWELCMTINNNWGYSPHDSAFKTPYEVITIFSDCISNGGTMLLDFGPKEDGTIQPEEENVLRELGKWNKKHATAIFNTVAGLPLGHFYGPTTLSKDSTKLYLFLTSQNSGHVVVKGIKNAVKDIKVVGKPDAQSLAHKVVGKISWSPVPGLLYIDVPNNIQDEYVTVLEVSLDGKLDLYRGKGGLK